MSIEHAPRQANTLPGTTVTLPRLMRSGEAAEYLGVSVKWLERDRWLGPSIPYTRVGKHVRYLASDLAAHLERHRHEVREAH